jgi:hypothetical protein
VILLISAEISTSAARPMRRKAAESAENPSFSADDPALKSSLFNAYIGIGDSDCQHLRRRRGNRLILS